MSNAVQVSAKSSAAQTLRPSDGEQWAASREGKGDETGEASQNRTLPPDERGEQNSRIDVIHLPTATPYSNTHTDAGLSECAAVRVRST